MSKKATVIAVVNQKGGTGKTTTTENPVSYTHLDVYKRQSYTHACILYFQDFCILFLLGFFYILLHLQQYANMHLAVFSKFLQICPPNPKFLFPEITFPLSQIGKPVSYTHLDVYKRQEISRHTQKNLYTHIHPIC